MKRLALGIVLLAALAGCGGQDTSSGFLDRYVRDDGRVVRDDQGGDTVSEGQAYALLLAVAADDEERFARVWDWTRTHLQRPDGLLAWRWADGHVVGDEPATDADLDAARALLLAGERFDEPRYREAARDMKRAIVDGETTWAADRTVLVAGPWARDGTIVVNPSYWSPKAFQQLGFEKVSASSRQLTRAAAGVRPAARLGARGAVRGLSLRTSVRRRSGLLVRRRPPADPARRVVRPGRP